MNSYHLSIFEEIRSNQNIFLLNGPSVSGLENKIDSLRNKKIIYWGVNNISGIENNILSKIDKNIDIYFIEYAEECEARIDDILNFLERKDSKLLIIGANWVNRNQALKTYLPKNSHKILLLEQYVSGNSAICNSLGSMLQIFLNIIYFERKVASLFIFGMDGINNPSITNDSHAYIETYQDKLPRKNALINHFGVNKTHAQAIYDDMIKFDNETMSFLNQINKRIFESGNFKIFNGNLQSSYCGLPKISQDEAIDYIINNVDNGIIESEDPKYHLSELTRMHSDMISFVNQFWIERFIYGSLGKTNSIYEELCVIKNDIITLNNETRKKLYKIIKTLLYNFLCKKPDISKFFTKGLFRKERL